MPRPESAIAPSASRLLRAFEQVYCPAKCPIAVCSLHFSTLPPKHPQQQSRCLSTPRPTFCTTPHLELDFCYLGASGFIFSPCLARWLPPSAEPCSAASRPGWPMRPVPSYRPSYNGQVPSRGCKSPANAWKRRPGQSNYLPATGANAVALMSGHQVDRTMHARCPFSGIWPLSAPG